MFQERSGELELKYLEARRLLVELCVRLHEIHDHPDYQDVWRTAQLRRKKAYCGPQYVEQLAAAEAFLKEEYVIRKSKRILRSHAKRRARERFGLTLNHAAMVKIAGLIKSNKAEFVRR